MLSTPWGWNRDRLLGRQRRQWHHRGRLCTGRHLGRRTATTLVDLAGDVPAALGVPEPSTPGVGDWLRSRSSEPAAGRPADPRRRRPLLLPARSDAAARCPRGERLAVALAVSRWRGRRRRRHRAATSGTRRSRRPGPARHPFVLPRLRRACASPHSHRGGAGARSRAGRLRAVDIEHSIGAPVVAQLEIDPAVARAVDAGLLANRLPLGMLRGLRALDPLGRTAVMRADLLHRPRRRTPSTRWPRTLAGRRGRHRGAGQRWRRRLGRARRTARRASAR